MPGYELDRLTYEVRAENLGVATQATHEPLRFYTEPTWATAGVAADRRDYVVTNGNTFATNDWTVNMPKFVTTNDLDDLIEKLYKIIEEHTTIDISEEEFMKILKE